MDINQRIAMQVRQLRDQQGLSLDMLAERSKVSRSHISLIERGESSPTAAVLDRLATALGVALAALFQDISAEVPSPVSRAPDQPVWTDPASGYLRRNLSPAAAAVCSGLQLVEVQFPAGARVALDSAVRDNEVHQQIWLIKGRMQITVGNVLWPLDPGDCLAMRLDQPIVFHNPGKVAARYLVALNTVSSASSRRAP
ncbi:helix-turn-helix domain-containing protein [Variovorax sp. HJSM1_2]|uniref:helix-turn-helix domain-containing protein n=1 Tax=Variovorax sp. HJSM1_2 TaxID=3366263 RepID=UPI003BD43B59